MIALDFIIVRIKLRVLEWLFFLSLAQLILKDDLELAKYHKKAEFLLMDEKGPTY